MARLRPVDLEEDHRKLLGERRACSARPLPSARVGLAVGYLVVVPSRDPSYEAWGLTLKALQLPLLVSPLLIATHHGWADVPKRAGRRSR
jgi:hypothetical protein